MPSVAMCLDILSCFFNVAILAHSVVQFAPAHHKMQPAYVAYHEAENVFSRAQFGQLGMWNEPMKVPLREPGSLQPRKNQRKSNAYTAVSRPPRATRVKTVCADGKALAKLLEDAAVQLDAAGVVVADDVTVYEVVDLYLTDPADLREAVRLHAAGLLVPDVGAMTNDEKIALANKFKSKIKAAVADLVSANDRANDICSLLMKAVVHHMDITKMSH